MEKRKVLGVVFCNELHDAEKKYYHDKFKKEWFQGVTFPCIVTESAKQYDKEEKLYDLPNGVTVTEMLLTFEEPRKLKS